MNFEDLIDQVIGGGYYYRPYGVSYGYPPERQQQQRYAAANDYDQILRDLILRQYLGQRYGAREEEEEEEEEEEQEEEEEVKEVEKNIDTGVAAGEGSKKVDVELKPKAEYSELVGSKSQSSDAKVEVTEPIQVSHPKPASKAKLTSPPLNLYEFDQHYIILLALPGIDKSQIDIDFHTQSNELIITGEGVDPYLTGDISVDQTTCKISEFTFGKFQRQVKLPHALGTDPEIKAKFNNGLLEIKVVKAQNQTHTVRKITLEEVPDAEFGN